MNNREKGESPLWIYHERQQAALCGLHALNNLAQGPFFSRSELEKIAEQLDIKELSMYGSPGSPDYQKRLREGSSNRDGNGNYSVQVLQVAMESLLRVELRTFHDDRIKNKEPTTFDGFLCHKDAHWFTIRKIKDRYWNLNSFLQRPEPVSFMKIGTELTKLENNSYTVFAAIGDLPPICENNTDLLTKGKRKYWWNVSKLIESNKTSASINFANSAFAGSNYSFDDPKKDVVDDSANATQDPWLKLAGNNGNRLGGDTTKRKKQETVNIDDLTEEEKTAYAIELSMQQSSRAAASSSWESLPLSPEPEAGSDTVQLRLQLPNKGRVIRKFKQTDTINYLYAVVNSLCASKPDGSTDLQLHAGYPRRKLEASDKTIAEEGLQKTNIQSSWI